MSSEDIQGDEWGAYVTLGRTTGTNVGSPTGCEPYGDGGLVVVAGVTTCRGGRESVSSQGVPPVDHAVWGGIQGLAVRASRMASMGRRPWLRALTR